MEFMEQEYDCAGMCTNTLFFFSKDADAGLPDQNLNCSKLFHEQIENDSAIISRTTRTMTLISIIALIFSLPLSCRYREKLD